ncbi:MAG: AMP-binding protein [Chloroflexi bacterium]|nr:AMP-binding protein [Chloroflexota bacterium]
MTAPRLPELLDRAAFSHPAVIVPGGQSLSYGSLRSQSGLLASYLRGLGIGPGDRVGIALPNSPETVIALLAVTAVATAVPINPTHTPQEVRSALADAGARALVVPAGSALPGQIGEGLQWYIVVGHDSEGRAEFAAGAVSGDPWDVEPGATDVAVLLHTSGTTGHPKKVPLAHANLLASARNVAETYRLSPDDTTLCVMPLFHVHGLVASLLATLYSGGTVVLPLGFEPSRFWRTAAAHRVTWYTAAPSVHLALLGRANRSTELHPAVPRSLRFARSCSAPLAPATLQEMEARMGVPVLEAYGMTEAAHQICSNPLPPARRTAGSVGRATGVEVAILNGEGAMAAAGTRGEVVIRGPGVITCYEDNPEADAASFADGWFRTGDEGVLDPEGYLTLTGRLKELIKCRGFQVSPIELEQHLAEHPGVAEVAVVGRPDPLEGEVPVAFVVPRAQSRPDAGDLLRFVAGRVAPYKRIRAVHFVEELPRSASGKVLRRALAEAMGWSVAPEPPKPPSTNP